MSLGVKVYLSPDIAGQVDGNMVSLAEGLASVARHLAAQWVDGDEAGGAGVCRHKGLVQRQVNEEQAPLRIVNINKDRYFKYAPIHIRNRRPLRKIGIKYEIIDIKVKKNKDRYKLIRNAHTCILLVYQGFRHELMPQGKGNWTKETRIIYK